MAEDLQQLHSIASSMLDLFEPGQKRRFLRQMATRIRTANQQRMARQVGPDGSRWEARKRADRVKPANRAVKFLYPAGGIGEPRLVEMRSWIGRGDIIIGFDRQADGMRSFLKDKVIRWITPEGAADPAGLPPEAIRARGRSRARALFRGLRSSRWLKAGVDQDTAWIEFTERASRLALIHHYGGRDRVAPGGPEIDYPKRELIGFSGGDEAMILNAFIDEAGDALGWGRRAGR